MIRRVAVVVALTLAPAAFAQTYIVPDGDCGEITFRATSEGGVRIAAGVPAQSSGMNFPYQMPGRYMVKATYRCPDPRQPGLSLVDTSTLTFESK